MDDYYGMSSGETAAVSAIFIFIWIISIAIAIVVIVGYWKIFTKAGHAGWKSLIPILNIWTLFEIAWGSGVMCLLLLIPGVDIVILVILQFKLARSFGQSDAFALGLFFLPYIFYLILGFGSSKYIGPDGNTGQTVVINQYNYNYGEDGPKNVPGVQINTGAAAAGAGKGVQVNGNASRAGFDEPMGEAESMQRPVQRPQPQPSQERDFKFCGHCGAKISKTAKFCRQCGSPVTPARPQPVFEEKPQADFEERPQPVLEENPLPEFEEFKLPAAEENEIQPEFDGHIEDAQSDMDDKLDETIITDKSMQNFAQDEPTDDISGDESDNTDDLSDLEDNTELLIDEPVNIGPKLILTEICDKGQEADEFSVVSTPYILGRIDSVDHIVESRGISKKHMQIDCEDGVFYITDLNSTNGVSLNDEKIAPMDRVGIEVGDVIKLGLKEYIVQIEE